MSISEIPVKPQASASRNVLHDMRKNRAVSSSGKSLSLVNLVTYGQEVKEFNEDTSQVTSSERGKIDHCGTIISLVSKARGLC